MFKNKKYGFTLAETLTVLGIIGVIAAMTVPTLYSGQEEARRMATLKKIYNGFQQNIQRVLTSQDGAQGNVCETISCLNAYSSPTGGKHNGILAQTKILNVRSFCEDCFSEKTKSGDKTVYTANGDIPTGMILQASGETNFSGYLLDDNSLIALYDFPNNCTQTFENVTEKVKEQIVDEYGNFVEDGTTETEVKIKLCGILLIDVNAEKSPNLAGKDRYAYFISDKPIDNSYLIPMGYTNQKPETTSSANYNHSQYNAGYLINSMTNTAFDNTAKVMQKGWSYSKK